MVCLLLAILLLGAAQLTVASWTGYKDTGCRGESKIFDSLADVITDEFNAKSYHETTTPNECKEIEDVDEEVVATEPRMRLGPIVSSYDLTPNGLMDQDFGAYSVDDWSEFTNEVEECWRELAKARKVKMQYDGVDYTIEIDYDLPSAGFWDQDNNVVKINPYRVRQLAFDFKAHFLPTFVIVLMHESVHGERDQNPNITLEPQPEEHRLVFETAYWYFKNTYQTEGNY